MKILGNEITVVRDPFMKLGKWGEYDYGNQTIKICGDAPMAIQDSAILHEVLEAVNGMLELELEHKVIAQLEAALYQVFSDNGVNLSPLFGRR